jgi:hypothetical protein
MCLMWGWFHYSAILDLFRAPLSAYVWTLLYFGDSPSVGKKILNRDIWLLFSPHFMYAARPEIWLYCNR